MLPKPCVLHNQKKVLPTTTTTTRIIARQKKALKINTTHSLECGGTSFVCKSLQSLCKEVHNPVTEAKETEKKTKAKLDIHHI